MRISTLASLLVLFTAISLLAGCSISYSTGKSSDAISASSDSISNSSDSDDDKTAASTASTYVEDVATATVRYASNQKAREQFLQTISNIARSHGIVDWEREKITYTAMGKGLKRAGINKQGIATLGYFRTLADKSDYSLVLKGYHQS